MFDKCVKHLVWLVIGFSTWWALLPKPLRQHTQFSVSRVISILAPFTVFLFLYLALTIQALVIAQNEPMKALRG